MKHICILFLALLLSFQLLGEEPVHLDRITLNTGEVYVGEIVVKTADIVMINAKSGTRYQFQLTEVRLIEEIPVNELSNTPATSVISPNQSAGNFSGQLEVSGGVSNAMFAFTSSPNTQVSLVFGNKKVFGKDLFIGVGTGYNNTFLESNSTSLGLIPVFARLQSTLSQNRTTPYIGMDAGYAFSTNPDYGGGTLIRFSIGISHRLNYKTFLVTGLYAGLNSISGNLTETNDLGTFTYYGNTMMKNFGVKVGLQF
ncbi:MAG TPA: hypothetical protein VFK73_10335 [Paludibacter sp.]|nr:hypothetical protein [Paludibacter sp.]